MVNVPSHYYSSANNISPPSPSRRSTESPIAISNGSNGAVIYPNGNSANTTNGGADSRNGTVGSTTYSAASTLPIHSHPPVVEDIPLHSKMLDVPGGLY